MGRTVPAHIMADQKLCGKVPAPHDHQDKNHVPPYLYMGLFGMKMLRLRDTVEKVQVHGLKKMDKQDHVHV
jgi:hypothetical protein